MRLPHTRPSSSIRKSGIIECFQHKSPKNSFKKSYSKVLTAPAIKSETDVITISDEITRKTIAATPEKYSSILSRYTPNKLSAFSKYKTKRKAVGINAIIAMVQKKSDVFHVSLIFNLVQIKPAISKL